MVRQVRRMPPGATRGLPTPLILFDGVCHLCTNTVLFVIRRDPGGRFHFASLQSPLGQRLLAAAGLPRDRFQTFVLLDEDGLHTRSTAALRVARSLPRPWRWLSWGLILPVSLRDGVYDVVARSRYRIMGRRETCLVPSADVRERFVDSAPGPDRP